MYTIEQYLQMLANNFIQEIEIPAEYLYSARIQTILEKQRWAMRQSDMYGWVVLKRLAPRKIW